MSTIQLQLQLQEKQKKQKTAAIVQAERLNKAEAEALRHRLGFLEWRQRGLLNRHDFRAADLRRNAKIFGLTTGSSHCSEPCQSNPTGYPQLHLRTDYKIPKLQTGFQTPEPIKERTNAGGGQRTLKWDLKCARTLFEPALDEQLFSLANMRHWRGGAGLGRLANHLHLSSLEAINEGAALRSYRNSRRRARFLASKARQSSGRLRLLQLKDGDAEVNRLDVDEDEQDSSISQFGIMMSRLSI